MEGTLKVTPRLGKILKERNMTQIKLSELTGIPQGNLSRFDQLVSHKDTHTFLISRALGISIEDLFEIELVQTEENHQ
ncbi:helix-turn-helix domain-containing protein [Peribacillus butanolivorans]|uniref:helix-turn-helix domain-containing protein n=1 Tax=Peribacillus butanolivorans TaxID=421767 RepID=UPI0039FCE83C